MKIEKVPTFSSGEAEDWEFFKLQLEFFFQANFGQKVQLMSPLERHAVLMLDEMSIKPALEFDASVGCIIGNSTLKDSQNREYSLATHALVFMLRGMSTRWKQTVGYHFTGPSFCAREVKEVMFDLIIKCEKLGLSIDTVVFDMGGQNQALWKECGIIGGKYAKTSNFCEHPCDVNRKLFFIPDTPHIMKSLRNHLTGHQSITVPSSIVDELGFTCKEVKIEYIKQVFDIDSGNQLKLAPLLRESCLQPNNFEKMKVGLAIALLNHQTGAAI
ncbi:hypothetical protein J437_LFUL002051 [Ladona fulva]|uniref:Transposable element P transposase-like RNase H domain-containing protein n=1 Tax=Ladona fulva TaxID=123851 RepID=A0A8K0JVC2_LADFU|nr:hypothetical protein J437_LFUL002051 [Ladona fulva]